MILTIPNFETKNKSGSKISSSKNDILQNIKRILRHKLSGLHIVYSNLRVINPVRDTTTSLQLLKSWPKILQNIIIMNIFNITIIPFGRAFLKTFTMKSLPTLLQFGSNARKNDGIPTQIALISDN